MDDIVLNNVSLEPEERLGPPKIDWTGVFLISMVALVTGFLIGIFVFLLSFLILGNFSIQSGVSPILFALITFFVTICGNFLYLWWLSSIFPHIYTRSKTLSMHISVFSIVLYICISWVYVIVDIISLEYSTILWIYVIHIIFNVFWLILITWILSMYRYSLLVFYSSMISLFISWLIPLFAFNQLGTSSNTLFVFMIFSSITFFVTTVIPFAIQLAYYKIYATSWYNPLGDVFDRIIQEEHDAEKHAEKVLFQ